MKKISQLYLPLFLFLLTSFSAMSTEILVWDKKPLSIRLEIGKERIIEFEDNIEIEMTSNVHSRLKIDAAAGVAYLTAIESFPKSRISVTLVATNERIFIDLFAIESDSNQELDLIKVISNDTKLEKEHQKNQHFKQSVNITIKELVQYASHDFFAPTRLKLNNLLIQESIINQKLNLDILFLGRSAGLFDLKPLKQYRTLNYNLTAIVLTNKTSEKQMILYKDIYPNFIAVSSQHKDVGPVGSNSQSTILYLVTEKPLADDATYANTYYTK